MGDRSGTIFKIGPNRQIFVFATLEPSIAAYHLAFGPDGYLYVTGPTTSSFDSVYRISHAGVVEVFYRGLGRPQGMAFDEEGRLYVAASISGRKGVVRIDSGPARRVVSLRARHRGTGVHALARHGGGHHQRPLSRGRRDQGPPAGLMNAEIIAVGSEMLTPDRVDTNSLYLTAELNDIGVEVVAKSVIGDDRDRLAAAIRRALSRSPILIISGGLGPTEDDVTREAVAHGARPQAGRTPPKSPEALERRFAQAGRKMAEINKRQAFVIEGADDPAQRPRHRAGPVDRGIRRRGHASARPAARAARRCSSASACRASQRIVPPHGHPHAGACAWPGMAESDLDQLIAPVYKKYTNPVTTILAAAGEIQVHLRARCATAAEADALLAEVGGPIELLLGDRIYSRNGDPLEVVVGELVAPEPRHRFGRGELHRRHARRAHHLGSRQLRLFLWAGSSPTPTQ